MRGIADQRDAAMRPCRNGISIHQWKFVEIRRLFNQLQRVEPWKPPPAEGFEHFFFRDMPVPVLAGRRCVLHGHLTNQVRQQFVGGCALANGIGNDPLMEMPCKDHGATTKEGLGIDGRAPQHLLGKTRLSFGRVELTPDGGMDAVGADQDIGVIEQLDTAVIAEPGAYPVTALLKFCESQPAAKALGAYTFAQSSQQQHLQLAAMDRVLWPSIPGQKASWLAADQLPEFVVKAQFLRCQPYLS